MRALVFAVFVSLTAGVGASAATIETAPGTDTIVGAVRDALPEIAGAVKAVPVAAGAIDPAAEPETWSLMILAFVGIALFERRPRFA